MFAHEFDRHAPHPAPVGPVGALALALPGGRPADCARLRQQLVRAEALLESDPDEAALLVDGLLAAVSDVASRSLGPSAQADGPLAALELFAPLLALRLRLALRAPDVQSRIVHARACLDLVESPSDPGRDRGGEPSLRFPRAYSQP